MFRATIREARKFTDNRLPVLTESVDLFASCFNTRRFYQSIINHTYDGNPGFYYTQRTTNDIYALLVMGMELFQPIEKDFEADLYLRLWRRRNPNEVAGHSPSSSRYIIIFEDWFDSHLPDEIAGLIAHEYCHKLGFHHPMAANPSMPYSVPYAVGRIVSSMSALIKEGEQFPQVNLPGGP